MAKDYKHRAHRRTRKPEGSIWQWLVISVLVGFFITFLLFLRTGDHPQHKRVKPIPTPESKSKAVKETTRPSEPSKPRFDFYTLLPEQEVIIPESEIKTRKREEKLGRAEPSYYVLQVGSFRQHKQADKLKAQLALLGIEAKVETAKIGATTWNRVKIGPYSTLAKLDSVRDRLRQNHIDAVVIRAQR